MIRINKYFSLAVMAMMGAGFVTSCDNSKDSDAYTVYPGPVAPVYFQIQPEQEIALGDNDSQFSFNVYRDNKGAQATQDLSWSGETTGFNVPSSVTFESGSDVAKAVVTFDINNIQGNHAYDMTVSIPGTEDSAFTQSAIQFNVLYTTWIDLGYCQYTDYFVGPIYGAAPITYEVQILEHPVNKGLYRLVNPYGEPFPYNDPGDWDPSVDSFLYVNAMNAQQVYICDEKGAAAICETVTNWGDGNFILTTLGAYYIMNGNSVGAVQNAGYLGYVEDGVIYLPSNSALSGETGYNDGALYQMSFAGPAEWIVLP